MAFQCHQEVNSQVPRKMYKKLANVDDEKVVRPKKRWVVKKLNARVKRLRLARARRFVYRALSAILMPKRIAALCSEIISRLQTEGVCPSIVFSSQWGLPVLSHSSSVRCF